MKKNKGIYIKKGYNLNSAFPKGNKFACGVRRFGKDNSMYGVRRFGEDSPFYDRHHSKRTKKTMSERKKGSKHPNWKGGITSLRIQIHNLDEYKQWRHKIYVRDGFACVECREIGSRLVAHHIKAFARIFEENNITTIIEAQICKELWDIDNGVTLCDGCHELTHGYRNRGGRNGRGRIEERVE